MAPGGCVGALRGLRSERLLPGREADWDRLLRAVVTLPPAVTLPHQLPYGMPGVPRPLADVYARLTRALQRSGPAASASRVQPEPVCGWAPADRAWSAAVETALRL